MTREVRSENFEFDHAGQRKHVTANHAFHEVFQTTAAEIEGQRLAHVRGGAWNLPALMEKLAEARNAGLRLEELLSRTIDNVIYSDDLPPHNEEMDRLLSGERRAAQREERYECDQEVACALGVPKRKHLDGYVLALAGVVELEVFAAHLLVMLTGLIEQWTVAPREYFPSTF